MDTVAIVVGVVALLRKAWPKLDGLRVPLAALLVSILVTFAYGEALPTTIVAALGELKTSVKLGLTAVGVMYGLSYGATKLGEAMGSPKTEVVTQLASELLSLPGPDPAAAYKAYGDFVGWTNVSGLPMPTWDQLPPKIRQAWAVATMASTDEEGTKSVREALGSTAGLAVSVPPKSPEDKPL